MPGWTMSGVRVDRAQTVADGVAQTSPLLHHRCNHATTTNKRKMDSSPVKTKTYFGYGSNLWQDQMARRCPASPFTGVGRLRGYQWCVC